MTSSVETMSRTQRDQLAYAASFDHATMVYGAKLDTAALHRELERIVGKTVTLIDQRTILEANAIRAALAKADAVHIALDWIVTPEIVAVLREALGPRGRRQVFTVLSTRAAVPAGLGPDLRDVFPILIAWDEVL